MLQIDRVAIRRGPRLLFEDATFQVHAGQRLGVVGLNGCGKSSLFALILGQLEADAGEVSVQTGAQIAHVAQEVDARGRSALDHVIDGDRELREIQAAIAACGDGQGERVARLYERLETVDGFSAESRAARLLDGLGFSPQEIDRDVATFSGGWRMRLNLAQALMCRSDLLLLDEPTNHLDLPAILWLEQWLRAYSGALLVISHDRDFLDGICTHVAHISRGALNVYTGDYSRFEVLLSERLVRQQALFERQQAERKHLQSFVDRFRYKASKARQAQSRVRMLERMTLVQPAHADSPFRFRFLAPTRQPQHLLKLEDVVAGYEKPVVSGVNLSLRAGDRIGLLGVNGAGKSTLVKALADGSTLLDGERMPAKDCQVGYFAQHQLEQLDLRHSAYEHLVDIDPKITEQEARNYLGGFDFQGERIFEPVAPFSGGEKARLVLALIIWRRPNVLLLDEPTNHLDLEARHALGVALQDFTGALVVIAHDRHLLRSVCDELLIVHDGRLITFEEDIDAYRGWLAERRAEVAAATATRDRNGEAGDNGEARATNRRDQRRQDADLRRRLKPLSDRVRRLEQTLQAARDDLHQCTQRLSDPALYTEPGRHEELADITKKEAEARARIDDLEWDWLRASEALEQAEDEERSRMSA